MGITLWILFGLLAGAVAKLLMPGRDPGGLLVTMLLGVAGASLGGFIGHLIWGRSVTGFDLGSFGLAVVGAIVVLFLSRVIERRNKSTDAGSKRRAA